MREEESKAHNLLVAHGGLEPPVPVEEIARAEQIQIAYHHFRGPQSGFAYRDGRLRIIGVNTTTSRRRQRFTIAHELGHIMLHEGKSLIVDHTMQVNHHAIRVNLRDERSSLGTHSEEIQANAFAAALLMPEEMVLDLAKKWLDSQDLSRDDLISHLARQFDVSTEAMGYRLTNLGILVT